MFSKDVERRHVSGRLVSPYSNGIRWKYFRLYSRICQTSAAVSNVRHPLHVNDLCICLAGTVIERQSLFVKSQSRRL
jgi:hypothetical protein